VGEAHAPAPTRPATSNVTDPSRTVTIVIGHGDPIEADRAEIADLSGDAHAAAAHPALTPEEAATVARVATALDDGLAGKPNVAISAHDLTAVIFALQRNRYDARWAVAALEANDPPCPRCGSEDLVHAWRDASFGAPPTAYGHWIECRTCGHEWRPDK
jgi:hypothetical protein